MCQKDASQRDASQCHPCSALRAGICSMPHSILYWYHRYLFSTKSVFIFASSAQLVGQGFDVKSVCRMMLTGKWAMRKDSGAVQKAALDEKSQTPRVVCVGRHLKAHLIPTLSLGKDSLQQTSHLCELCSGPGPFTNRCSCADVHVCADLSPWVMSVTCRSQNLK